MPRLRPSQVHEAERPLARAADALARQVAAQWSAAEEARGLRDAARVRWVRPSVAAVGPVAEVTAGAGEGPAPAPLPDAPPVTAATLGGGTVGDLFALYAGVASGRLLVMGAPGAGKTSAAIRLVLQALDHRAGLAAEARATVPVPVLLTPHDWSPGAQSLEDWLTDRLVRDHACHRGGPDAAARLVAEGLVSVVVDGLDDIPAGARSLAMAAIGRPSALRVVVLGRTGTFVEAAADGPMRAAAAAELRPLAPGDLEEYLVRSAGDAPGDAWARLVDHVRSSPQSPLAQAAASPLVAGLLRDHAPGSSLDELRDAERFPSAAAIEDHLLDGLLARAYARRPGEPRPPLRPDQARELFGWLAASAGRGQDIAWWRLRDAEPRSLVVTARVVRAGVTVGVAVAMGTLLGPLAGLVVGAFAGSSMSKRVAQQAEDFSPLDPKRLGRFRVEDALGRSRLRLGLQAGLASALLVWLVGLTSLVPGASLATGAVAGAVTVVSIWVVCGYSRSELDTDRPMTPRRSYRQDRAANLVAASVIAGATTAGGVLVFGAVAGLGWGVASFAIQVAPAQSFQLGATSLCRLRSLRLMAVLDDASRRNVLRTAGPYYQFRHARLQRRLAAAAPGRG